MKNNFKKFAEEWAKEQLQKYELDGYNYVMEKEEWDKLYMFLLTGYLQ